MSPKPPEEPGTGIVTREPEDHSAEQLIAALPLVIDALAKSQVETARIQAEARIHELESMDAARKLLVDQRERETRREFWGGLAVVVIALALTATLFLLSRDQSAKDVLETLVLIGGGYGIGVARKRQPQRDQ